jgi:hypothetical protein
MNFAELKEIIKYLKKTVTCTTCNKKFINEDIRVLSTIGTEGLFHIHCHHCHNEVIVHITIFEQTSEKSSISIETRKAGNISENDILDIHNFLKQFNGDFKQLFTEPT